MDVGRVIEGERQVWDEVSRAWLFTTRMDLRCGVPNCVNTQAERTVGEIELRVKTHDPRPDCQTTISFEGLAKHLDEQAGLAGVPGWQPIAGVGPDTPTKANENGASQSDIPYSFHTMPVRAVMSLAQLQSAGDAKYGVFNWRGISLEDHVNHAITHLMAWLAGDRSDAHLQHGAWRALAALERDLVRDADGARMLDYWEGDYPND